jgi:hypothetical protein
MSTDEALPLPGVLRGSSPPRRPPAPPAASPGPSPHTPWEAVIAQGKACGYLTFDQIDAVFDILNRDPPADLQPIYDRLIAMGIEVAASAHELSIVQPPQTRADWARKRAWISRRRRSVGPV